MSEYGKIKKLIDDGDELISKRVDTSNPEFQAWKFRVTKYILQRFGEDSIDVKEFKKIKFSLGFYLGMTKEEFINDCKHGIETTKAMLNNYLEDVDDDKINMSTSDNKNKSQFNYKSVFVVHGHDDALKEKVARIIEKQHIKAIILSEQTNKGKTIIEKFEEYADVPCAICLFTKDDIAIDKGDQKELFRARQNVVFETGYFMGKIGREKVIILSDSKIDMPSDLSGVLYINNNNWETDILKELRKIGYNIDMNKL